MIKYLFILFFFASISWIEVTNLIKLGLIGVGIRFLIVEIIFIGAINVDPLMLGFNFIVDSLGLRLIILSAWIILLIYLSSYRIMRFNEFFSMFRSRLLMLFLVLLLTFSLRNYLLFYFFFWSFSNSHIVSNFRVGVPAWTSSSRGLFYFLYSKSVFAVIGYIVRG